MVPAAVVMVDQLPVSANGKLQAAELQARVYPGFPTDLQSVFATLLIAKLTVNGTEGVVALVVQVMLTMLGGWPRSTQREATTPPHRPSPPAGAGQL